MQNGIYEAFNSKMRGGLLNETTFVGLDHAREIVGRWVADHNAGRPYSAHGYPSPPRLSPLNLSQWAISST